jgi:hypothetical protein
MANLSRTSRAPSSASSLSHHLSRRTSRCTSAASRRWASTNKLNSKPSQPAAAKDDGPDDFRAQLYASTFARVQKEKAEQARFSEMREARRQGGGNSMALFAVVFGMFMFTWASFRLLFASRDTHTHGDADINV